MQVRSQALAALLIVASSAHAQFRQDWFRTYQSNDDVATSICFVAGGGLALAGYSGNTEYSGVNVRWNSAGSQQWIKFLGGSVQNDRITAVAGDAAGNLYVAGELGLNATDSRIELVKYSSAGSVQWSAYYNPTSAQDYPVGIKVDGSGNVFLAGVANGGGLSDFATAKFDNVGVFQWGKLWNPFSGVDRAVDMAVDNSGGVFVAGTVNNAGNKNAAVIKYDSLGSARWAQYAPGPQNNSEGLAVAVDNGGNVTIVGRTVGVDNSTDALISKFNGSGSILWGDSFDQADLTDTYFDVAVDGAGNIYAAGSAETANGPRMLAVKYSPAGSRTKSWLENVGGSGGDKVIGVGTDNWGRVYLYGASDEGGTNGDDLFFRAYKTNSPYALELSYTANVGGEDVPVAFALDNDGHFGLAATTEASLGASNDMTAIRLTRPAVAIPDTYSLYEDGSLITDSENSLKKNDEYTADAEPFLVASPQHGVVTIRPDGTFDYAPDPDFEGTDTFTYRLIREDLPGNIVSVSLGVEPLTPSSFTLQPANMPGGNICHAKVTLVAPAGPNGEIVTVKSSHPAIAPVPGAVVVPQGQTVKTFDIPTTPLNSSANVTVEVTSSGVKKSAIVHLTSSALASLTANPSNFIGGHKTVMAVNLSGPAPTAGRTVSITDNSSALNPPASVFVVGGSVQRLFDCPTSEVTAAATRTVTGTLQGISKAVNITLQPLLLVSVSMDPAMVKGGDPSTGTVTMNGPAPVGKSIALTDNSSAIFIPANVGLGAGQSSVKFGASTSAVAATATRQITAKYGSVSKVASLTLTP